MGAYVPLLGNTVYSSAQVWVYTNYSMDIYVSILYREWGYGDYVVIMGLVGIL